jgi:RecA/RadA recombinase
MPPIKKTKEEEKAIHIHPRNMTAAQRRELFLKAQKEEKPDFRVLQSDDVEELVPYGLIVLDNVLGLRGIGRRGRVSQIHGSEGAGKSTLTYQIAANYQKATGEPLADYDFERTGTVPFIQRVGVDPSLCHFEQPDSVESCIKDTIKRLRMGVRFFIYDSIPRMKSKVPMDDILKDKAWKGFGANHARSMGMFYDLLLPWLAEYDGHFMMVNQTRDRIEDSMEASQAQKYPTFTNLPYSLPGGRVCRFTPSVMIELKLLKALKPCSGKEGEDPWLVEPMTPATEGKFVVNAVRARTLKNKVTGMGYREGTIYVRPGIGIDEWMSVRQLAREYGLINYVGKKWVVGTDSDVIVAYDTKDEAIQKLVVTPDTTVLARIKMMVAKLIDSDETSRFQMAVDPSEKVYLEGQVAVEPGDEVEMPKSKAFQILED